MKIFSFIGTDVFCVHKPGFLMPGQIRIYMYVHHAVLTLVGMHEQWTVMLVAS